MHKLILFLALSTFPIHAFGQYKAITDEGKEVILNADGTWRFAEITKGYDTRLDTPSMKKSTKATFMIKGNYVKYGLYIDPQKWKYKSGGDNTPYEYMLNMPHKGVYAIILPENLQIDNYESFRKIVIANAQKVAPDATVIYEDVRKVNGIIVHMIEYEATVKGIKAKYLNYYYVGKEGTIQLITFTSQNLFDTYKDDMQGLLNGFTLLD